MRIGDLLDDPGLQLAVLGALLEDGALTQDKLLASLQTGIARVQTRPELWVNEDPNGEADYKCQEEILQEALGAMAEVDVTPEQLAGIEELSFDGGAEIYMWFEHTTAEQLGIEGGKLDTGGESELYTLRSFRGIEHLAGLTSLDLDAYGFCDEPRDATPLARLPALSHLSLEGAELVQAEKLAESASLTSISGADTLKPDVIDKLVAAGKQVE